MPRGRKRRTRLQPHNALTGPDPTHESRASKQYTSGQTVKYKWRIAGPISPITTTHTKDPPT